MFNTLIESIGHGKNTARASMFLLITTVIYTAAMSGITVGTILWFNPSLTDALDVRTLVSPPSPSAPPTITQQIVQKTVGALNTFAAPTRLPEEIPDPTTVQSRSVITITPGVNVPGHISDEWQGRAYGIIPGDGIRNDVPLPPPVNLEPTPTPALPPKQIKVSGGVLQGNAIKKVSPSYPSIARAARAQGIVEVQVTISEEGRVIAAQIISGHPLLREAALQAAHQWIFQPTELSRIPVKVQGVLKFDFKF